MRVQRAPSAAAQPQPRPNGVHGQSRVRRTPSRGDAPKESGQVATFSAAIDLDITSLTRRTREPVVAELVVRLVEACRAEGLVEDDTALQVVRPTDCGLEGVQLDAVVLRSTYAIASRLAEPACTPPQSTSRTLTVVDLTETRARVSGDWGLGGGLGAVTFGSARAALVPGRDLAGAGLGISERQLTHVTFTVRDHGGQGYRVLRVLDALSRSVEDRV